MLYCCEFGGLYKDVRCIVAPAYAQSLRYTLWRGLFEWSKQRYGVPHREALHPCKRVTESEVDALANPYRVRYLIEYPITNVLG